MLGSKAMSETKIILGPPGTGKTTTLLSMVESYLAKGIPPSKIGFISFTKKAVNEAVERAVQKFAISSDDFKYFRTIHSLCFRQLTMSPTQVMQRKHYIELGEITGVRTTGIHRQDEEVYEMPEGDQMVFIESLARLTRKTLKDCWEDIDTDIDFEKLDWFKRSLDKFKKANLLSDFTDMLVRYYEEGLAPELEVLFIDEAQDLCKLQWDIVNKLAENSKYVYIAGDDDQAIFRWSGADIDYFLSLVTKHHVQILEQSYRLPKSIFILSQDIAQHITNRTKKIFLPKATEGKVEYVNDINDVDLEQGEWLILVRNGFMVKDCAEQMRLQGLPYETTYYSIKEDEALQAALTWESLRSEREEPLYKIKNMLSFMSAKHLGNKKLNIRGKDDTYNMKSLVVLEAIQLGVVKEIWHKVLDKISAEDREYYIAARRRGEMLSTKPRIKISTIHGAKGGEAQNVMMFLDMSVKTYTSMVNNPDDEARVFYVGVTRAKENLFIVQPQTLNCFEF